jgi:hypothetical protein
LKEIFLSGMPFRKRVGQRAVRGVNKASKEMARLTILGEYWDRLGQDYAKIRTRLG